LIITGSAQQHRAQIGNVIKKGVCAHNSKTVKTMSHTLLHAFWWCMQCNQQP
jgi:hypothetical protein